MYNLFVMKVICMNFEDELRRLIEENDGVVFTRQFEEAEIHDSIWGVANISDLTILVKFIVIIVLIEAEKFIFCTLFI